MVLLGSQQDMGAAVLFFSTFLVMLYHCQRSMGLCDGGLGLFLIGRVWRIGSLVAWRCAWTFGGILVDASAGLFQIVQSLIALGEGGIIGQGLGQGAPRLFSGAMTLSTRPSAKSLG